MPARPRISTCSPATCGPSSGTILLAGRDVTRLDVTSRARIGIARSFQRNNLFPDFTVRDNLVLACALRAGTTPVFWRPMRHAGPAGAEADEIAEQVGLTDALGVTVRQLSYGSQRQLEVALALACRPQVLLLDEPTSGMSPEETARMHELIGAIPRALTVIVIEHDMDIVLDFADRIIVLDYGRVLEQGTPAEIRASTVVRERYLGEHGGRVAARGRSHERRPAARSTTSTPISASPTSSRACRSRCRPARCWRCSGATAPARRRRCARSCAWSVRAAAA